MKVHFGFVSTEEMKEKIDSAAKINKKTSSDIIREALNFYFQKQDEKEILKAILTRLEYLRLDCQNLDLIGNRTNSFLNHYSENRLNAEDYKKLRADVLEEITDLKKKKGYDKK
jgi:predicted DNA-binding protein